jgi:hypothetical protein
MQDICVYRTILYAPPFKRELKVVMAAVNKLPALLLFEKPSHM